MTPDAVATREPEGAVLKRVTSALEEKGLSRDP